MNSLKLVCTNRFDFDAQDNEDRKDKIGAKVEGLQNLGKIYVK